MKSCIYKGRVKHQRFEPRSHEFTYSLFMMYVDLDELLMLFKPHLLWTVNRPGVASFYRKDHFGDPKRTLSNSIRELVYEKTGDRPCGPIRLLTHFRYFGYVFNPLSLYFCFDEQDSKVEHVVAEVMNTPWREQHCYVLSNYQNNLRSFTSSHQKEFHVSPFMDLSMEYRWKIQIPNTSLNVQIENWQDNKKVFDAAIDLQKTEISSTNLSNVLLNFPLMTLKVISAIHFEALKLWMKGITYIPHPKH